MADIVCRRDSLEQRRNRQPRPCGNRYLVSGSGVSVKLSAPSWPQIARPYAATAAVSAGLCLAAWAMPPQAAGSPCDGPGCVPNLRSVVSEGGACAPRLHFPFGIDAYGTTFICLSSYRNPSQGIWSEAPPLVGVRASGSACAGNQGVAQSPDGLPLLCSGNSTWDTYTTDLPPS
ncbi:hypothetical protein DIQ79_30630 [Mycolicibacterium smegmatis]|uniref:Uncharacterized protein n=1 Tax=Mycolicibacterium smegmatis (strain ATCC 700084 / mc(2)155) TaxID=246196 RepID=A0QRW6_MYCS2|nr:conserved hypothetical protein [Mycolicibacterium smegmatis MC2 155]TBM39861.1 hypothetical protein DIQ86_27320 [Mycolicibacterium smegmatis]TBH27854.1 hypothetical protein EYS45_29785 [Mycolicibacterium smegmatis MC2 155]TBM44818.1 hypothetical protein DIQ85_31065 [Mycolicibacterium smegmatis]TBM54637.1 hypothetical protein DIQ83_30815 [Mycolicibacterium smegmatis]